MELTPAYGRDYKTGKAAKEAFEANLDFLTAELNPRLINREQIPTGTAVVLRFKGMRNTTLVKVTAAKTS